MGADRENESMDREDRRRTQSGKRKRSGRKGAVSVFLTIILVPCIVVACLFDDVSRVQLSRAEAESAADLSLHSLLSNYDHNLKEYYGLVASCQDIEKFYDVSEQYFRGMMGDAGVSDVGEQLFADYIRELRSGSVADFLQAEIADLKVTELPDSKLGENPVLIEDGIVEFMKYRGPVQITEKVLDRFSKLDLSRARDAAKDEPIAQAKREYAEAESELLKDAFYTYLAIKQYSDAQQATEIPSRDKYAEIARDVRNISDDLKSVTEIITLYYAATSGIRVIDFPAMGKNTYTSSVKKSNVGYLPAGSSEYCLSRAAYDDIVEEISRDLPGYIEQIRSAGDRVGDACIGIEYTQGSTNPAIYCMQMQEAVSESDLGTVRRYGEKMLKLYARIKAALECGEDPAAEGENRLPGDWRDTLHDAMVSIDRTQSAYLDNEGNGNFGRVRKRYFNEAQARTVVEKVKNRSYTFQSKYCGAEVDIGTFISSVNQNYKSVKKVLKERSTQLKIAISGGHIKFGDKIYKVKSLEKLKKEADEAGRKLREWNSRAKSESTDYAKDDTDESNKDLGVTRDGETDLNTKSAQMAKAISAESVNELKTRLTNIQKDIDSCLSSLNEMKYGKSALSDLGNAQGLITAAIKGAVPNSGISISLQEGRTAAKGYAEQLSRPSKEELFKSPGINSAPDGNDMDLSTKNRANRPALYRYLCDQFEGKETQTSDNVEKAEDNQKKWKEEAEKSKENNDNYEKYTSGRGTGIGKDHRENAFNESTAFKSLLNTIMTLAEGNFSSFRDEIYVTEYIMDMFSWSSFNNEGKYRLADNKLHANKDFPYSSMDGKWNADKKDDVMENQSLTNLHFCKENNKAFLGEVEYILYGDSSWENNVKTCYRHLFEIRELMNLGSGFYLFSNGTKTSNGAIIQSIADAVATATAGIVPPILTKCILIGVLATMESCKDLEVLKEGAPVTLYKSEEKQWFYTIKQEKSGSQQAANASFNGSGEDSGGNKKIQPEDPNGLYYSDYLYVFLLLSARAGGNTYKAMLLRTGNVIEANMGLKKSGYDLSKARCYFKLHANVLVKPLMLSLPIVDTLEGVNTVEFREKTDWRQYIIDTIRGYS